MFRNLYGITAISKENDTVSLKLEVWHLTYYAVPSNSHHMLN